MRVSESCTCVQRIMIVGNLGPATFNLPVTDFHRSFACHGECEPEDCAANFFMKELKSVQTSTLNCETLLVEKSPSSPDCSRGLSLFFHSRSTCKGFSTKLAFAVQTSSRHSDPKNLHPPTPSLKMICNHQRQNTNQEPTNETTSPSAPRTKTQRRQPSGNTLKPVAKKSGITINLRDDSNIDFNPNTTFPSTFCKSAKHSMRQAKPQGPANSNHQSN